MDEKEVRESLQKAYKKINDAQNEHQEEIKRIQKLCTHSKLGQHVLIGNPCLICGKIVPSYEQRYNKTK